VHPAMTTASAHIVAHEVEEAVKREFPDVAEVVVHVAPEDHG
jgi:divalent metal cation (Fe/Co/Zn/Cd) transporter